jgi:hypothetical protein
MTSINLFKKLGKINEAKNEAKTSSADGYRLQAVVLLNQGGCSVKFLP